MTRRPANGASIVGSGPNATTLHYTSSTRQMRAGDLLLVDAAANFQGLTGDITRGLVLIGIGGGLVGMADNILRPLLLSGRSSMNGLVTFVALLGGMTAFGLIGLVFGPVVVAIGTALLNAYIRPVHATSEPS